MAFLDIESAVMDRLASIASVYTVAPADLASHLPAVVVHSLGGHDLRWQVTARVVVSTYAASRTQVWQVAEDAAKLLMPGFVGVEVRGTDPSNARIPSEYTDISKVVATYEMAARRSVALL